MVPAPNASPEGGGPDISPVRKRWKKKTPHPRWHCFRNTAPEGSGPTNSPAREPWETDSPDLVEPCKGRLNLLPLQDSRPRLLGREGRPQATPSFRPAVPKAVRADGRVRPLPHTLLRNVRARHAVPVFQGHCVLRASIRGLTDGRQSTTRPRLRSCTVCGYLCCSSSPAGSP